MRLGPWELGAVLAIVVLVFGPGKLPVLGSSIGECIKNFKKSMGNVPTESKEIQEFLDKK